MTQITDKGKENALERFRQRCKNNKGKTRVNNDDLRAGSDMYYYCRSCGDEMRLPETHPGPAPRHCGECKALKELGWLE